MPYKVFLTHFLVFCAQIINDVLFTYFIAACSIKLKQILRLMCLTKLERFDEKTTICYSWHIKNFILVQRMNTWMHSIISRV